jgi:23S rRNA (uracil1939-C5)-methyltransferase
MGRRQRRQARPDPFEVTIEGLSHEGRGIAHHNGKTVFVFAALPGERALIQIDKSTSKYAEASIVELIEPSAQRIEPRCPHFNLCGGCSMQHVDSATQIAFKQQSVLDMLSHAGIQPGEIMQPLRSPAWGYRRKARLGVKFVIKKQRLLIGFRERNKPYLADMQACHVLVEQVGLHLTDLMQLIEGMDARDKIAQIEVAADDAHTVLVFRHLEPLSDADTERLTAFAQDSGLWVQLQAKGPDSMTPLYPEQQLLYFSPLADSDIRIAFGAADFAQVNNTINQAMVQQALDQLDLQPDDRVLDLFCGLGNFTLPMARLALSVTGVEGDPAMVERAKHSALANGIDNTEYHCADLSQQDLYAAWLDEAYDKVLLDPPRSGAYEIMPRIARLGADTIVYVSCQPSSLVRDARVLVDAGYALARFCIMDMFPQTAHVESMAVFRRK